MSETFYIKKTAFDDNNFDLTQREEDSFIIGPGELNGPGGVARDSDLELYGFGAIKWGEGVDQNQYRQLENSACPAKETGDFLVGTDAPVDYVPGTGSFNTTTDPITPKDENDLGIGNGITEPLDGQSWYNTTDRTLYTFGYGSPATEWRSDMTATNTLDLDGFGIVNMLDPTDAPTTLPGSILAPQDAVTVGWADIRFVNVTGDDMVGTLSITDTLALDLTGNMTALGDIGLTGTLTITDAVALVITGDTTMAGDLSLTDGDTINLGNSDDLSLTHNGTNSIIQNTTGTITIENTVSNITLNASAAGGYVVTRAGGGTQCAVMGGAQDDVKLYYGGSQRFATVAGGTVVTGNVLASAPAPTDAGHLTRMDYVEDNYVADAGGTMNSNADLWFQGGGEVLGLPTTPSGNFAAASKIYVDTVGFASRVSTYSSSGTFIVPTGVTMIFISGAGAGQGGQGGGDGPTGTPTIPSRPSDTYVNSGTDIIRLKGGESEFGALTSSTHATLDGRALLNLAAMAPGLMPQENCTDGDNCQGGRGGASPWGNGGIPTNSVGGDGGIGAGGAGGYAQDFNEGQDFGWGGASGGFVFGAPVKVTPGQSVTVVVASGTAGTSGSSGRNGGAGGNGYIIINW